MKTKCFYEDGIWQAIVTHPKYGLGKRELEALIRFLPAVADVTKNTIANVLHLGVGNGREIEYFVNNLAGVKTYLANDICAASLKQVTAEAKKRFPGIDFIEAHADIELEGAINRLRRCLSWPALIVLVANAVIFSNRLMDENILQAMREDDYFLVTLESYHGNMFRSYAIKPVYDLLSRSGLKVTGENVEFIYDDQCLKMLCQGETLLSSYKPTPSQLRERMSSSGFKEISLKYYEDIHMIGALYKKGF